MAARRNAASSDRDHHPVAGFAARKVAFDSVATLLDQSRGFALEDALSQAARTAALEPADAALARAIATTTFRHLGFLRAVIAERMREGLSDQQPRLFALLATGAAQILDLAVPDHATVDIAVRLAKAEPELGYLSGLVNAVLRRIGREREAILAEARDPLDTNTPAWLAQRWRARYGEDIARRITTAHLRGGRVDITAAHDAEAWAAQLGGSVLDLGSIRLAEARRPVAELPGYDDGAWWVQDAAAALPARLLQPQRGERIADLCAAPGGKTAQLVAAGASVVSIDRSAARLERLTANLARLHLSAEIRVADILELPDEGAFDAVLLDAPCSSTGTIRRHPDVAWTKRETDIGRLATLQTRLLEKAAGLVKPGGRLVYCTCSLEPEEGEAQAVALLARHPDFERLPIAPTEVAGHAELIDANGDLRTLPCHLGGDVDGGAGGLDGFFAARFRRLS